MDENESIFTNNKSSNFRSSKNSNGVPDFSLSVNNNNKFNFNNSIKTNQKIFQENLEINSFFIKRINNSKRLKSKIKDNEKDSPNKSYKTTKSYYVNKNPIKYMNIRSSFLLVGDKEQSSEESKENRNIEINNENKNICLYIN